MPDDPDDPGDAEAQAERFARLMRLIEDLARAAGVTRDEYMADVVEGRRPPINAADAPPMPPPERMT